MNLVTRIKRAIKAFNTEPQPEKPKVTKPASTGFGESARGLLELANTPGHQTSEYCHALRRAAGIFAYCEQIAIAREALNELCTQQVILAKNTLESAQAKRGQKPE